MTVDNLAALLRAREEELSAIYENVPGIVFYIALEPDGGFRFRSVSRDFLSATGLNREQVVGSLVGDVIPPPSRAMVLNHYREAVRSGRTEPRQGMVNPHREHTTECCDQIRSKASVFSSRSCLCQTLQH